MLVSEFKLVPPILIKDKIIRFMDLSNVPFPNELPGLEFNIASHQCELNFSKISPLFNNF